MMVRSKYFYYLFLMNALINIINFVPRVLLYTRFRGALPSIFISVAISSTIIYIFVKALRRFEGQGLPEILNAVMPRGIGVPLLFMLGVFWFFAGSITMLSFVDISLRYISPDISPYAVIIGFLLVVGLCCRLDSDSILYGLETLLLLVTPAIAYMLIKAFMNPLFSWDAVMQMITYMWTRPKFVSIAGATFVFSGYINLVIFNRSFKKLNPRHLWLIPVFGLLILLLTFLVPVGYQGTIAVEDHIYSWFSTADSIRMELFIVERVLFLFYTIYLTLSLVSAVIHWHVGLELLKGMFQKKGGTLPGKKADWWILAPVCLITIVGMNFLNQVRMAQMGQWFLNIRFFGELLLLASIIYANRRSAAKS